MGTTRGCPLHGAGGQNEKNPATDDAYPSFSSPGKRGDGDEGVQGASSWWGKKEGDLEECRGCRSLFSMERGGTGVWAVGPKKRSGLQRVAGNGSHRAMQE